METKIAEQSVTMTDVVFDECLEQAVDTEFTLPDYCPD